MLWGWRTRLGLAGLLLPIAANLVGLLWPLLATESFELQYVGFHKVCLAGSCSLCQPM